MKKQALLSYSLPILILIMSCHTNAAVFESFKKQTLKRLEHEYSLLKETTQAVKKVAQRKTLTEQDKQNLQSSGKRAVIIAGAVLLLITATIGGYKLYQSRQAVAEQEVPEVPAPVPGPKPVPGPQGAVPEDLPQPRPGAQFSPLPFSSPQELEQARRKLAPPAPIEEELPPAPEQGEPLPLTRSILGAPFAPSGSQEPGEIPPSLPQEEPLPLTASIQQVLVPAPIAELPSAPEQGEPLPLTGSMITAPFAGTEVPSVQQEQALPFQTIQLRPAASRELPPAPAQEKSLEEILRQKVEQSIKVKKVEQSIKETKEEEEPSSEPLSTSEIERAGEWEEGAFEPSGSQLGRERIELAKQKSKDDEAKKAQEKPVSQRIVRDLTPEEEAAQREHALLLKQEMEKRRGSVQGKEEEK